MGKRPTEQEIDDTQQALEVFQRAIKAALNEAKGAVPFSDAAMCGMVLALLRQAIDMTLAARVLMAAPDDVDEYVANMDLKQAEKLSVGLLRDCWRDKRDARATRKAGATN